ncbi:hypothetical protein SORBI_3003G073700 [Sorghum bicolor]|nr:hypothetical protein SORBI_3003G073700 [Sorghum bicolor]
MNDDRNKNNNKDEASSDLQLMLREIAACRSPQSNDDESDVDGLQKLENLLRNALKDTRSRKMNMLAKQNSGASTSGQKSEGVTSQEQGTA